MVSALALQTHRSQQHVLSASLWVTVHAAHQDMVPKKKPDPAIYFMAAEELGVSLPGMAAIAAFRMATDRLAFSAERHQAGMPGALCHGF